MIVGCQHEVAYNRATNEALQIDLRFKVTVFDHVLFAVFQGSVWELLRSM